MCCCQQINKSGHHLSNTVKFYLAVCPICSLVRKSPDRSRPLLGDETHVSPVFARSPISMSLRICCSWPSSRRVVFSLAWQLMIFIFPSKQGNPWASAVTLKLIGLSKGTDPNDQKIHDQNGFYSSLKLNLATQEKRKSNFCQHQQNNMTDAVTVALIRSDCVNLRESILGPDGRSGKSPIGI